MKIIIFAPYYLPHIDGLGILIDDFCRKMSLRNFQITVFTPHLPGDSMGIEDPYENVRILRFPAFYIVPNYPIPKLWKIDFWRKITTIFRSDNEVTLSYMRFFIVTFFALIYSRVKKTKWIHIEHGSSFVTLSSRFKMIISRLYDYTLGMIIFKFSDINVSASSVVRDFIKKFDSRYSPIIFNSIDIEKINKSGIYQKIDDENKGKIIISFVGRLYKWKGVEISMRIIKSLPKEIKDKVVFLIVGDGEDYGKLSRLAGDDASVRLLGELSHEEALKILKCTNIYIHSAMPGGGLSGSLLEAMCLKCAIVATPNEGAQDVIIDGKNGFLVKNENEARARLIDLILDADKRLFFGENAARTVRDNFNLDIIIKKYEKLIWSFLNQSK